MTSGGAVGRPGEGSLGARLGARLAATVVFLVACLLASPDARGADSYPRLVNIYFPTLIGADLEKLSRWDVLVLPSRADEWYQDELDTLRRLNPDIQLIAHMPVGYHGDWTAPGILGDLRTELYEHDWWLKDTTGLRVVPPFGFGILNMTTWSPCDEQGKALCDWLPEYIAAHLGPGGRWDGLFLDLCMDDVAWVGNYVPNPIDADRDGLADGATELNEAWKQGMRRMADRLRELVGDEYILVTNGNNTLYDLCDGSTREDFPNMHGGWYENIANESYGYMAIQSEYRQPAFNIVNSIWYGDAGPNGAEGDAEYERQLRYGLTSTLVYGDGHFSMDGLDGTEGHCHMWWHPLYDVDLGQPVGRAEDVTALPGAVPGMPNGGFLKMRRFTGGLAVVNPTGSIQVVSLPGTYYRTDSWNGLFYPRTGAVSEAVVRAYSGDVLVGSGHVLASAPAIEHARLDGGEVTISWQPVPGVTRYSVYRADCTGGLAGPDVLIAVVDAPSHVDRDIPEDAAYRYAAAAIDSVGCEGELSRPVDVSTEPGSDQHVGFTVDPTDGQPTLAPDVPDSPAFAETAITGCSPNPVEGEGTTVSFSIGGVVGRGEVPASLTVYDAAGRVVRRLLRASLPPGPHAVRWRADNERGSAVASGCYFCTLEVGGRTHAGKVLVVR